MSYGPYQYRNGNKYTFASDGRWWLVTSSHGGDDFGYPVTPRHPTYRPQHHAHSIQRLPIGLPAHHHHVGPSRRIGTASAQDPDDLRIRQLALAINHQAGWIATWQGIGGFYAASLAGASAVVFTPMAGAVANRALLGPAEGRIFYESYTLTRPAIEEYVEANGGRIITDTPLGAWIKQTIGFDGWLSKLSWKGASWLWAAGAGGSVQVFMSNMPNDASYLFGIEIPQLYRNCNIYYPFILR